MGTVEDYYNNFYRELAKLDAAGNDFSKIKDMLPTLRGDEKILDIGAGYGTVSEELVRRGFKVFAIEINDEAIEKLKQKGFIVLKKDINQSLGIDEKFDIVLLLDVLEHVFNPLFLLQEVNKIMNYGGYCIVTVPLYFDILDRLKILFTGSIISLDNLCYGKEIYNKFRSFNYDHIRFFRPKEVLEMVNIAGFKVDKLKYIPTGYYGKNKILKILVRLFINKYTVNIRPTLLSHSMKIRLKKEYKND